MIQELEKYFLMELDNYQQKKQTQKLIRIKNKIFCHGQVSKLVVKVDKLLL